MRLGRTAITVITPAVVPSESGLPVRSLDPADGATRRRVRGCNVQPVTAKVTLAGQTVETAGATIYAPAAAAVTDDDALEIDGEQYAVQGDPRPWRSRSGRGRFLVIDAIPWDRLETYWRLDTLVERLAGHGPMGAVLDPPVSVRGFVVPGARLVRATSGDEIVSSTTVYYPIGTAPIPAGSFITAPPGLGVDRARVITCAVLDGAGMDTADHMEVTLE